MEFLLCFILFIIFLLRFKIERIEIKGNSMETTLNNGENVIVKKVSKQRNNLKRYDIIVFKIKEENKDEYYIKRIIGLPGEKIQIREEIIYINEIPLKDSYKKSSMKNAGLAKEVIDIRKDNYFILGDNREISLDSRHPFVGMISKKQIIGKVILRIRPFSKFGKVDK